MRHSIAWPLIWMSSWLHGAAEGQQKTHTREREGRGWVRWGGAGGRQERHPGTARLMRRFWWGSRVTRSAGWAIALILLGLSPEAQLVAHGDLDLLLDQVHAGDHLSHRVLHLRVGVGGRMEEGGERGVRLRNDRRSTLCHTSPGQRAPRQRTAPTPTHTHTWMRVFISMK